MEPKFIPYSKKLLRGGELQNESMQHYQFMDSRRTVREFSTELIA